MGERYAGLDVAPRTLHKKCKVRMLYKNQYFWVGPRMGMGDVRRTERAPQCGRAPHHPKCGVLRIAVLSVMMRRCNKCNK